jgi:hypothetical protein
MEKHFKKGIIFTILISVLVAPSFALAAWWNPFTWGWLNRIFHFQQQIQKQEQQQKQEQKENPADSKTYKNNQYGFQFLYPEKKSPQNVYITEGNKVYVNIKGGTQSVEIFSKDENESFESAIKRIILKNFPSTDCKVEIGTISANNYHGQYQKAEISYPAPINSADPFWKNSALCNSAYDKTNGLRYFAYDPSIPDKFAFFDVGQFAITISENSSIPWQDTFKFTDVKLVVWPDKNSFDLVGKTFFVKNLDNNKKIKVITTESTKYYTNGYKCTTQPCTESSITVIKTYDFQGFYSLMQNWQGPAWRFILLGKLNSDGSVTATEIFYTMQG